MTTSRLTIASTRPARPSVADATGTTVSTLSRPRAMAGLQTLRSSGDVDLLGELDQLAGQRRLLGIILPGGVARDGTPLVHGLFVEVVDRGALLLVDVGDLLIVGHRLLGAERLHVQADRHDGVLMGLGHRVEYLLRHDERLEHEPIGLAATGGEAFRYLLHTEGDHAGRRRH